VQEGEVISAIFSSTNPAQKCLLAIAMNYNHHLDNPVWYSLQEVHMPFSIQKEGISFYLPAYCPFGGFIDADNIADKLDDYAAQIPNFYIVGEKPPHSASLHLNKELICNQMLLEKPISAQDNNAIVRLEADNRQDLFRLVNLVQPGYFKERTPELGAYFGIYENRTLVAVSGERMKMNDYTEVSAVVTHPNHTGKGYAKRLIAYTTNAIFNEGKIPYLHVAENNEPAISLYEKLGFKTRRKISFWNFVVR
jgi:ribosomal protein S18 acetylase RimI-like enzyme